MLSHNLVTRAHTWTKGNNNLGMHGVFRAVLQLVVVELEVALVTLERSKAESLGVGQCLKPSL